MDNAIKENKANSFANPKINTSAHCKIFLIGMMGSGKTFWAEKLNKKLKIQSYDLDALIEMMEEKTIAEIFEQDGEEYFRKAEAKMLRLFAEKKLFILSCGGGTACYNDNMNWMNKQGITIWINESPEIISERLVKEKNHRPLIKNLTDTSVKDFVYRQAQYELTGENLSENTFIKIVKEHA